MWKVERGTVTLSMRGRPYADREPPLHLAPLVRVRGAGDQTRWRFRASHARWVALALQEDPGLARALYGTFRDALAPLPGMSDPAAWDGLRREALKDLHEAVHPKDLKSLLAQAVVREVVRRLRTRLPYAYKPHPFQLCAVAYAALSDYRCGLFDEQGLGKTPEALACLAFDPARLLPAVVVAPASVFGNWQKEAQRWLPTVPVVGLATRNSKLRVDHPGVVVVTWDGVRSHINTLRAAGVKTVIADEAHYAKEETAQRSKGLRRLAHAIPHAMLLTGTPIKNRAAEVWHLLHILYPELWPDKVAFGEQYAETVELKRETGDPDKPQATLRYEGGKNLDDLRERLSYVSIRRIKANVLPWLPDKQRVVLPVQLTPAQRAEYDRAEKEFADWLAGELRERVSKALKAQGIIDPQEADARLRERVERRAESALEAEALVKIGYLRRLTGTFKVAPAIEQVKTLVDQDEPVLVFCDHLDIVHAIEAGLTAAKIKYATIAGATTKKERTRIVDAFQSGKVKVFVGTQAAKEGLTLTAAWNTVFVERWWSPADEEQAEDRTHRIGQKNATVVWFLEAEGTVDGRIRELIDAKRQLIAEALGSGTVVETQITLSDFMGHFRAVQAYHASPEARAGKVDPPKRRPSLPKKPAIQAVAFDPRIWTDATARRWLAVHDLKVPEEAERYAGRLLYPQKKRKKFRPGSFRFKGAEDGIAFVLGRPR